MQSFSDSINGKVISKVKDVHKRKPIREFVKIKTKMHCILLDVGYEFNTAKGLNTAMEFIEYNDILFNKRNNKTQNEKNSQ